MCIIVYVLYIVHFDIHAVDVGHSTTALFIFAACSWIYCVNERQISATNDCCADFLQALPLLFTEKYCIYRLPWITTTRIVVYPRLHRYSLVLLAK